MAHLRSRLQQVGTITCGLTLSLFGCPPSSTGDSDGNDSALPVIENPDNGGGADLDEDAGGGGGGNDGGNAGGGGNTDNGPNASDRSPLVRPNSPTLFVADLDKGVASFANAHVLNGNVAPTAFFDTFRRFVETFDNGGGETFDSMAPTGVSVDRIGALIIPSFVSTSNAAADAGQLRLRSYDDAASVSGIPAADREIFLGSDGDFGGTAYDRANDRLFLVVDDTVLIFEGAALAQSGNVAPTRSFSNPDIDRASIALGPNGDLYATGGFQTVLVFSNAGNRSGEVTPDRTILLSGFSRETVFVDSLDRLYVTDFNEIAVLNEASKLDGTIDTFPVIALQRLSGQGAIQISISGLAVDSRGIGYVAVGEAGEIHIIDSIGKRSGDVRADRAIFGSAVGFGDADAIFLWE